MEENIEENAENNVSGDMLKSWTIVKPQLEVTEVTSCSAVHYHDYSQSEDSDGISVIIESAGENEVIKTFVSCYDYDNDEIDKVTEARGDDDRCQPKTTVIKAASTPADSSVIDDSDSQCRKRPSSSILFYVSIAFVITTTVLYLNIRSLNNELQMILTRVQLLEQENKQLKTTLSDLERKFEDTGDSVDDFTGPLQSAKEDSIENRKTPKTKTVWFGNEVQGKVEILDKKSSAILPDYCYFTDENNLFYEYNVEHCEEKRRKLEAKYARVKKSFNDGSNDGGNINNIWKEEGSRFFDGYISETLKSLNDEIQNIKRKRKKPHPLVSNPSINAQTQEEKIKKVQKIGESRKPKKLQRQNGVKSAEWVEKRTNGREEARKNSEKQHQDVNWYLKRKDDREIVRVGSSVEL